MKYTTLQGQAFDLERDFSSPERHVLQKLLIWVELSGSLEEFRRKTLEALKRGWADSGPVPEGQPLRAIVRDLEARLTRRLHSQKG
jgi:hypothetical protein